MPRKFKLTWDKSNKSWLKYYKGKRYYCGTGKGKYDLPAYEAALSQWIVLEKQLNDEAVPYNVPVDRRISVKERKRIFDTIGKDTTQKYPRRSLAHCVTLYLDYEMTRVRENKVTFGYYRQHKWSILIFLKWMGPKKTVIGFVTESLSGLSTARLRNYRKYLNRMKQEGRWTDSTINRLMAGVRGLTKWCVANAFLPSMPVGFQMHLSPLGTTLRGRHTTSDVYVPSLDILHTALRYYKERALAGEYDALEMLTYFIFGLNIGGTPIDLAWVTTDEWEDIVDNDDHLFLRRTKTGVAGNFALWKPTVDLVNHIRAAEPLSVWSPYHGHDVELLFKTPRGKCLSSGAMSGAFGVLTAKTTYNAVTAKWYKERAAAMANSPDEYMRFSVKHLRKMGADRIAARVDLPNRLELVSLYLRHSHRSMASKHYIARHDKILSAVLRRLYDDLQLDEILAPVLHELDAGNLVERPVAKRRSKGG